MPICVDVDICTPNPQGTVPVPLETEPYLLASEYQELRAGADGGADGGRTSPVMVEFLVGFLKPKMGEDGHFALVKWVKF